MLQQNITIMRILLYSFLFTSFVSANSFLTPMEKQWIGEHKRIKACVERDWAPFSYVSTQGKVVGLSKDYTDAITDSIGLEIEYIPYNHWEDILTDTKLGKCDLLNGLYYTKDRAEYIDYTAPYLHMKEYFFTREDDEVVSSMLEIQNKKLSLALVKGYAVTEWVKKHYPTIKVNEKETIVECLYSISTGESDVFIGDSPSTRYNMEENFISGIRMPGINKDRRPRELRMGVKKEYSILANILSKSIEQLSEDKQKIIKEKWMSEIQEKTNWKLIGSIFSIIIFIGMVIILFNIRLRAKVQEKTEELNQLNRELESKVKERTKELSYLNDKLSLAANTDPMTGIYNRRYFFDISKKILAVSQRKGISICIAMLDIDNFKDINDTYGHDVGDIVIKKSVSIIQKELREDDTLIRFGGEEFIIMMIDTTLDSTYNLCESIRKNLENSYLIDKDKKITISIGISEFQPNDKNIDTIVKRADNALYQAKRTGRNRVVIDKS